MDVRQDVVTPDQETLPREGERPDRIGRYQLLERIGGGGMGVVFKARHLALNRIVAVKILHPHKRHLDHLAARFWREMEAAGKLDDRHVVRASDAGQEGDTLFLAMEFIEGIDLDRLVQLLHPISFPDVCELMRQAALGLEAIRRADMVHRDVKPSNLILSRDGVVKILDVGLALLRNEETKDELTPLGATLGTADYLAPEQAGDSKQVDIRADVYSLGCTMYKLLTGHPPYSGEKHATWSAKLAAHVLEPLPPIDNRSDIPPEAMAILQRMTAKDRAARFHTPAELAAALKPFAAGADVGALVNEQSLALAAADDALMRGEGETPHQKGSTVAWTRETKRSIRRIAYVASAFVVAAFAVGAWAWFRAPETEPIAKKSEEEYPIRILPKFDALKESMPDLDEMTPVGWRNLLDRPAKELLWKGGDGSASHQYVESLHQLNVIADSPALLAFARTTSPKFTLQVGFAQPRWTAGAGIFLGYRRVDPDLRTRRKLPETYVAAFQYLRFQTRHDPARGTIYSIMRGMAHVVEDGSGKAKTFTQTVCGADVPHPSGEQILEIVVEDSHLRRVRFGSADLDLLAHPKTNERFEPEDYQGPFGAYASNSSCMYRNVRFMRHD